MRLSVGLKVFSVAMLLLLLAGGVAWINANQARQVRSLVLNVVDVYVPAYGALARANVRSVEESAFLRRLILAEARHQGAAATIERLRASTDQKGRDADKELATARTLIRGAIGDAINFGDNVALGRLETRLELMEADRRSFGALRENVIKALESDDRNRLDALMPRLDQLRDDFNEKTELARREMLRLLDSAGRVAVAEQERAVRYGNLLLSVALALGLLVATAVTISLVRPLRLLLGAAVAVQQGALDTELPVTSRDEVGQLTAAFNSMVRALRAQARLRETFGRYVDPRIVKGLIDQPNILAGRGERQVMTVFFCDMKGFTSLCEGMTPAGMVNVVNRYLAVMSEPIREQHGIIDKYIGDAIMAFWGPPFSGPDEHARLACMAALEQLVRLESFRAELPELVGIKRGLPHIDMRIGIATGEVVVGNIGSDVSMSYTVMGDTVNFASRIEGANKVYGTRILIDAGTADQARGAVAVREIDSLLVVGKQEPQKVFEVLGPAGQLSTERQRIVDLYAMGLDAYRRCGWAEAEAAFRACLEIAPDDGPSQTLLARIAQLAVNPPPGDWNGVWTMSEK